MELSELFYIALAIVAILIFAYFIYSPKEGLTKYYIPFTQRDRTGSCWRDSKPMFYEPKLMYQYNRCGDYGFNY